MCSSQDEDCCVYLLSALRRLRAVKLLRPLPLYPLPPLPAPASKPSRIFSLYISPDPLSFPAAPTMKTPKSAVHSGANPRLAGAVQWVVMWPTTAEIHDPWTPSIRLSAPALASDTHRTSAREWKHATGKCINVRKTLEPYKIICSHFVQHLTCTQCECACMRVNTHTSVACACESTVINVSRALALPSCGFVCVSRLSCPSCARSNSDILLRFHCCLSHTRSLLTQAASADSQHIRPALPSHTCSQYVCGGGSADRLAVAVKLAPFSCRCQVLCLAARGCWG